MSLSLAPVSLSTTDNWQKGLDMTETYPGPWIEGYPAVLLCITLMLQLGLEELYRMNVLEYLEYFFWSKAW